LRYGKFSAFDYLASFIRQDLDSSLICPNGFSLFEIILSTSKRFINNKQWVILPDSTGFGFYLLIKKVQHLRNITISQRDQKSTCFHSFIHNRGTSLEENFYAV
jgi:hypothetical protein